MHDPIARFSEWFASAAAISGGEPNTAMTLATATKEGIPSVRVVLLKSFDNQGFVFYTNMQSRKSLELIENPHAALCFYWPDIGKQVRIEGVVSHVSDAEADAYFAIRPLISRIGANASAQSRPLDARSTLMQKVEILKNQYNEKNPPPRPAHWSGWRLAPQKIEFWQEGEYRLHDRELYSLNAPGKWDVTRLYP